MTGTMNRTAPREIGRPSKYSPKLAGEILQRLASGEMLMGILRRKGMPGRSSVYRWMKEKPDFRDSYARAREIGAHSLVEEGLAILDASTPERVHLDNSRANYRRWLAGVPADLCRVIVGHDSEEIERVYFRPDSGAIAEAMKHLSL